MKLISKFKNRIQNNFFQNVLTLATGTGLAQLIAIILMPILSRLYTQEAFGLLTSYTAIVTLLSSFVTLKYDTALVLPKEDRNAYALLKLSNGLTLILTFLSVLILFIPISYFSEYQGLQIMIGLGTILSVNYNNSSLWNIRFKQFKITSISKIIQILSVFVFQFILYSFFNLKGLVIGNILGVSVGGIYLIIARNIDYKIYKEISLEDMKTQAIRYIDFPKYFTISNFIMSLSANLPVLLFINYISYSELGLYGMAMTLIIQPVSLISGSFKSVILSYMAEKKNSNQKILKWYVKNISLLLTISIAGSIVIICFGEIIIEFFLGSTWKMTGTYIKMLVPLFIGMMIATPSIAATRVFELQKYGFIYSIVSLITRILTLLILFDFELSFSAVILTYSIVCLLLIVINNLIIYFKIKKHELLHQNL